MTEKNDNEILRSEASIAMDKLLERSAKMKERHQATRDHSEDLKQRTDDLLSELPDTEKD